MGRSRRWLVPESTEITRKPAIPERDDRSAVGRPPHREEVVVDRDLDRLRVARTQHVDATIGLPGERAIGTPCDVGGRRTPPSPRACAVPSRGQTRRRSSTAPSSAILDHIDGLTGEPRAVDRKVAIASHWPSGDHEASGAASSRRLWTTRSTRVPSDDAMNMSAQRPGSGWTAGARNQSHRPSGDHPSADVSAPAHVASRSPDAGSRMITSPASKSETARSPLRGRMLARAPTCGRAPATGAWGPTSGQAGTGSANDDRVEGGGDASGEGPAAQERPLRAPR